MSSLFLINTSYQVYTNVKAYENEYEDLMEHETLLNIANVRDKAVFFLLNDY